MSDWLFDGPDNAEWTFVFAHGAGAPMDSPFMETVATGLGERGIRVLRFEFSYMAKRREDGKKRPPSGGKKLMQEWRDLLEAANVSGKVAIGGKSMGGRLASQLADEVQPDALLCLGYPFHPPGKPDKLRTEHLEQLSTPTLVLQGERDPFGKKEEVETYTLSPSIQIEWLPDGDHSLKPRKKSGHTEEENLSRTCDTIHRFLQSLG
ncbi:MAG: alpha/beta hydrolase [Deltaproteobacteria bacterium]|nr:MAG: alpha/beta hydrolase [Deltaproteobacteria bacterium]